MKEEPTIFRFVLAWREGFTEIPRQSHGVKGLGRESGGILPPPLDTLAGMSQVHNAMVFAQHSTPRCAPAVDGCQECLRESRGDRVMTHDGTCPEAST